MHVHTKLKCCVITNIILVGCILLFICVSPKVHDTYMRWGPQADLKLLGVAIDTWERYWTFQVCLAHLQFADVIVQALAGPIMAFNIYNPDKKVITEFTKNELQLYAQTFWFLSNIKGALMMLVSITQLDIALSKCVYNELAGVVTIRYILNEKTFRPTDELSEALLEVVIDESHPTDGEEEIM